MPMYYECMFHLMYQEHVKYVTITLSTVVTDKAILQIRNMSTVSQFAKEKQLEMNSYLSDPEEDCHDDVFINTEHVSQTEELIEERKAVTLARNI